MEYASGNGVGSTSPSNGLGNAFGSSPGSIDPGIDPIERELKSSINPWMPPTGGTGPGHDLHEIKGQYKIMNKAVHTPSAENAETCTSPVTSNAGIKLKLTPKKKR